MELVGRKYSKYFKNLARKIKKEMDTERKHVKSQKTCKQWIQDRKHVKGCSFSKPRVADQVRKQKKASGEDKQEGKILNLFNILKSEYIQESYPT